MEWLKNCQWLANSLTIATRLVGEQVQLASNWLHWLPNWKFQSRQNLASD